MDFFSFNAWILDAQVHKRGILLWLKKPSGKVIPAIYPYYPSFYAALHNRNLSASSRPYQRYISGLEHNPHIYSVSLCQKRVKAEDPVPAEVLQIKVASPFLFKKIVSQIRNLERFDLYNVDIPLVQMFFYEIRVFPFAFCSIKMKKTRNGLIIDKLALKDSNEDIHYNLPPLRVIWLEINTHCEGIRRTKTDIILSCTITQDPCSVSLPFQSWFPPEHLKAGEHGIFQVWIDEKNEYEILIALEAAIQKVDPDIIFTSKGDEELFPYLLSRLSYHHLEKDFSLSRDNALLTQTRFLKNGKSSFMSYGTIYHRSNSEFYLNGRLHIDSAIYGGLHFDDGNLYGIVEVARVTYSPLQRLTRVTIGGALQSLQFFHAYRQNILITEKKKNVEYFRSGEALLFSDRGGHILNPKIGMFDRVAELDFTSMYPALMVEYNVSPETINCACCKETGLRVPGLEYYICVKRKGIVPLSLRVPLMKRIQYKALSKSTTGKESHRYTKMNEALKWILVVCFGYLGFRNARFGRIEAHQTVCAYSREFLLNAMSIVERYGLTAIHGIVDSLYVQPPATMDIKEFHDTCQVIVQEISQKTQIPINFAPADDYFQFLCFLPTKADPSVGALNRYWGVKPTGAIKVRGIELRRHDSSRLIKKFQRALIDAIALTPVRRDLSTLLSSTVEPLLIKYFRYLEQGTVSEDELAIHIRLTRSPSQYKVQNYQAIAASSLERNGRSIGPGEKVSFIITNDKATLPQNRVQPIELYRGQRDSYDIEKYKELLVRAALNLLPLPKSDTLRKKLQSLPTQKRDGKTKVQKSLLAYFA
jgi:DNA polymerase-2